MTAPIKLTIDSALEIDGREDTTQLEVQGHQSQTAPLQQWTDHAGTPLTEVTSGGRLRSGDLTLDLEEAQVEVSAALSLPAELPARALGTLGQIGGVIADAVAWVSHELQLVGVGAVSGLHAALKAVLRVGGDTDSPNAELRAGDFEARQTTDQQIGRLTGVRGAVVAEAGTITEAVGLEASLQEAGGSLTTAIGLEVGNLPTADEAYAIHTGQGPVHLGDYLELTETASPPAAPAADSGLVRVYPKDDGKLYARNDLGAEYDLTGTGDQTYEHDQPSAAAIWNITHNLGKIPSVTVVDSASREVIGLVTHNSVNALTIEFSAAFSGKAYLN